MPPAILREPTGFDTSAYLRRLGFDGPIEPLLRDLERIHRAQAYAIPFENFDILLGRAIDIRPAAVFDKLVRRRRGGYCFELNQLLFQALTAFGFEVRFALARVHLRPQPSGLTHVLLLVRIDDDDWIADVGFGSTGLRAPIRFLTGLVFEQDGLRFRLREAPPFGKMLEIADAAGWRPLYSFEARHVLPVDLELGNLYTSTHPDSFFTWSRVAALPDPRGRTSLLDDQLTIERDGRTVRQTVGPGDEFIATLSRRFGIELDAPYEHIVPRHPRPEP